MVEHLTREQIAALIDEPDVTASGRAHLDVCEDCAHEFEAMSRTRMVLSGLPDLEAPEDGWARIAAALNAPDAGPSRGWLPSGPWGPVLSAAAVLVLFLGGMGVGWMVAPGGSSEGAPGAPDEMVASDVVTEPQAAETEPAAALKQLAGDYPEYMRTVAELRELREGGPTAAEIAENPALAAERLTRLDALIEASREALRETPADPALNDFLFDVIDERTTVAGQLDQSLRQASLEY